MNIFWAIEYHIGKPICLKERHDTVFAYFLGDP